MFMRLVFRCGQCRQVCSFNARWKDQQPATITCSHCRASYVLPFDPLREPDDPAYLREIRALASEHEVDRATACSIREGILSPQQAKLPPEATVRRAADGPRLARWVTIGTVLALAALVVAVVPRRRAESAPAAEAAPAATVIHVNEAGRITRVWGIDPRSVLLALCDHPETRSRLKPAFIAAAHPPGPGVRLGLVHDLVHQGAFKAVTIRKDGRTGRWYAGNGRTPMALEPLATPPPDAEPI